MKTCIVCELSKEEIVTALAKLAAETAKVKSSGARVEFRVKDDEFLGACVNFTTNDHSTIS